MRFKAKTALSAFFLSVFVFPAVAYSQANEFQGNWALFGLIENGKNIPLIVRQPFPRKVVINFPTKDSFSVQSACNLIDGKYTADKEGNFKFSSISSTLMYCSKEASEIDKGLARALSMVTKYQLEDEILTFKDNNLTNFLILTTSPQLYQSITKKLNLPRNDWKRINVCRFSFNAPGTLRDLKAQGIDSCVATYEDTNLRIAIDYGWYSGKTERDESTLNYKEENIQIGGKLAQVVTFNSSDKRLDRNFFAQIYVELHKDGTMTTALSMTIAGKSEKDLETAKEIFKTIKFQ